MSHDDDFTIEPIKGLPALLPKGEEILWQGRPAFRPLAWRVFCIRLVMGWFGIVIAWYLSKIIAGTADWGFVLPILVAWAAHIAIAAGILSAAAWGTQRTTVYTITNRRVVMRFGMALDLTVNLPFSKISNLDLRRLGGGTGDLSLALIGNGDLGYMHLWPHARPWRFSAPEAMLRAVPQAEKVGRLLADAIRAEQARLDGRPAVQMPNPLPRPADAPAPAPAAGTLHPAE